MKGRLNKEQVERLLELLSDKLKEPKNSQIRQSLRKMLDNADLRELRDVMHLSGYRSVDYSFIEEEILRTQLEVDNLRMEDAAHSTQIKDDEERFFLVCIHAFYQIENIINYFYVKAFPEFKDTLAYIEKNSNFTHKEDPKTKEPREKSVGDIDISFKMHALLHTLYPSTKEKPDYRYITILRIKDVRNEGSHRCQIEGHRTDEKLLNFYKRNDANSIRNSLRQFVEDVQKLLANPPKSPKTKETDYGTPSGWSIKEVRNFTQEEIDSFISNTIEPAEHGNAVRFDMKSGGRTYIPLAYSATKGVFETIDMQTAKLIIISKEGEKDKTLIYC
jgi:hypothetical protein